MHNFNSISVSLCLLFKCTERKQHPCRNLADNMRHRLLSSARFLFFLSTRHSSSHRTIFKWHNFGKTAMYMSCVLCIKTGERDKTFFLPRRLRLLLHSFLTLKKYLLSNRTLKAPCCPKEHETFVYSNLFNCFQFVFPTHPRHSPNTKLFLSAMLLSLIRSCCCCCWCCWECDDDDDDGGEGIYSSTKDRNLFLLLEECEEFSWIFMNFFPFLYYNSIR